MAELKTATCTITTRRVNSIYWSYPLTVNSSTTPHGMRSSASEMRIFPGKPACPRGLRVCGMLSLELFLPDEIHNIPGRDSDERQAVLAMDKLTS